VLKWFARIFLKWSLLLGLPSSIIIAVLQPSALPVVVFAVFYLGVLLPALLWFVLWIPSRNKNIHCEIDEKGLGVRIGKYGFYGPHCYW
ncbi:hypothetical protein Q0P10_13875, partial [Staphylococcus aureus]|nr:hypothetical protein [Staphylococcus aureus]